MSEILEKIRRWVDGEDSTEADQHIQKIAQLKKKKSQAFLKELINAVDEVLQDELIILPSGKVYLPQGFSVYLSESASADLRKDKREFLEEAISDLILEKAFADFDNPPRVNQRIEISLRFDATLRPGEIVVRPVSGDKTVEFRFTPSVKEVKTDFTDKKRETIDDYDTFVERGTIDDDEVDFRPLYLLEVWQDGRKLESFPIIKREITIGRDDEEKEANIKLKTENRRIARLHCGIALKENGEVVVTALHKNPTVVAGEVLRNGETAILPKGQEIQIKEFTIRLRFAENL
jgi:hypothetical protein